MNPGDNFLIIGLAMFLIPVIYLFPFWLKEVLKLGNEKQTQTEVNQT